MIRLGHVLVVVAFAGVALGQTQPAAAGTALIVDSPGWGPAVGYIGATGETNNVIMSELPSGEVVEITDTGATVTVGTGCTSITPQQAQCPWPDNEGPVIDVELGDLNDSVLVRIGVEPHVTFLRGGEGDDVITGGDALGDHLFGGPGDDTLMGREGHDSLDGGPGADTMSGGSSGFWHGGGPNRHFDSVSYWDRANPVRADADGVADDGEAGEGDNIRLDIEAIGGGSGDDILTSGFRGHWLSGGPGDDLLVGDRGKDSLSGWTGDDILRGGPGPDFLSGDSGNDSLNGGTYPDDIRGGIGNDVIVGGPGRDHLRGGNGSDLLLARDGYQDIVGGGLGTGLDRARVDRFDFTGSIERFLP